MLLKQIQKNLLSESLAIKELNQYFGNEIDKDLLSFREPYKKHIKPFFIDFWNEASTGNDLVPGIAIDAVAEHIMAWLAGEFKTLLVVMPPREGKSTLFSVMLPAYLWTLNPRARFLTTSYSHNYAKRDNLYMQELIKSAPYQKLWGNEFHLIVENGEKTMNSKNGVRTATSVMGQATGEGGSFILGDDLNNVIDMHSKNILEKTNDTINRIFVTRQNMASETKIAIAQHRCSHIDAIGAWLSKNDGDTCYVCIPMEHEIKRRTVTVSKMQPGKIIWEDPRKKEGEILSPERYTQKDIDFLKIHMGNAAYSALYQGKPIMDEAAVFKEEWFKFWPHAFMPDFDHIIMSWDTAISTDANSCYSAMSCFGVFKTNKSPHANLMLLSMWTGKKEWHELIKMMRRLAHNYEDVSYDNPLKYSNKPDYILVEAKANGQSLIQALRKTGVDCIPYHPPRTTDKRLGNYEDAKTVRARLISPIVESGKIWVPTIAPHHDTPQRFAEHFIRACTIFPSNAQDSRDIVDTFTMSVDWLKQKQILYSIADIIKDVNKPISRHKVY